MMRIAWAMVCGGVLFGAAGAHACEAHAARARSAPVAPDAREKDAAATQDKGTAEVKDDANEPHAARCRCNSAADCTCRKGTCECSRCKPRRQAELEEAEAAAMREARRDEFAGVGV